MMSKGLKVIVALSVVLIGAFLRIDYLEYSSALESSTGNVYVSPEWYKQPVTHMLVQWSEPRWKPNGANTQMWLESDGLVDGKVVFWTVWEVKEN